ncbi:MAG: DUF1987 domain-containing protein [Chlorobi bacterium]|nr:DUF1987 domain-containing protein [Chlorobiota bacterium]
MKALKFPATEYSPEIDFDPVNHKFLISGYSRPENVRTFYYPVLEWIDNYGKEVLASSNKADFEKKPINLTLKMNYFNSSSAKFLLDVIVEVHKFHLAGYNIVINWFYDEGDDDMLETGEDLSDMVDFPFNFIENNN